MTTFGDQVFQYGGVPVGGVFTTGSSFFVHSGTGSDSNSGKKPSEALATLDVAVGKCTASKGDVIYLMPGHAESLTAQDIDIDVAGVSVIGLGSGALKPTFTYAHANAEIAVGAANVTIKGVRFFPAITGVLRGVDVEATFAHATIEDCDFLTGEDVGVDEFVDAVYVNTTATDFTFRNNTMDAGLAGAAAGVTLATPTRAKIHDNTIMGDFSVACVRTITGAGVMCELMDNVLINGQAGALNTVACFTQSAAGTWIVGGNRFAADVATFVLFFTNYTSTVNLGNVYTDDSTMAATATDISATIVVSADA